MNKKTLLIQLALFISSTIFGQQMQNLTFGKSYQYVMPEPSNQAYKNKLDLLRSTSKVLADSITLLNKELAVKDTSEIGKAKSKQGAMLLNKLTEKITDIEKQKKEQTPSANLLDAINKLNASEKFIISTSGALTNLTDKSGSGGSLVISTKVRLTDYKPSKFDDWVDPHFIYIGFNARSILSEDSTNILKNIIFPEISKRDFVLGYERQWLNLNRSKTLSFTTEAGLNKVIVDTTKGNAVQLRYESLMVGFKYTKLGQIIVGKDTAKVGISLSPNISVVNIQPKYKAQYDLLITEKLYRPTWWMLGFQAAIQLTDLQVFCSGRYILNQDSKSLPPDLRGFVYTLGTVVNLDVFKL